MRSDPEISNGRSTQSHGGLQELVSRARAGSNSALGRALSLCRPRLLRDARRGVGRRLRLEVGASDVVQDTYVNATKGFGGFRGRHAGEFINWLCMILAHRVAEIARRTARASVVAGDPADFGTDGVLRRSLDDEPSPSSIVGRQEHSELIRAGLAHLSPRDQDVLNLRFQDDLTFPQIGQRLGLSEDAARMLFARAVKRLKRRLAATSES